MNTKEELKQIKRQIGELRMEVNALEKESAKEDAGYIMRLQTRGGDLELRIGNILLFYITPDGQIHTLIKYSYMQKTHGLWLKHQKPYNENKVEWMGCKYFIGSYKDNVWLWSTHESDDCSGFGVYNLQSMSPSTFCKDPNIKTYNNVVIM